jgi:hypothetical protein
MEKSTEKQQATVITSSDFDEYIQKLKDVKQKEKRKQAPETTHEDEEEEEEEEEARTWQKHIADGSEVDSHSCAQCCENYHRNTRINVWIRCSKCSR